MTTKASCSAFNASAESYDRLMGRYLPSLAPAFADAAGARTGMRLLDVGCGPGGLTRELVARTGADRVAAIDPSEQFVDACRVRLPEVDVRLGAAEQLPFDDAVFDAALASLVVGFMSDPVRGLQEMARVTKPGGTVAACFWDLARMPALSTFWTAVAAVDQGARGELRRPGGGRGELGALLKEAGVHDVREGVIEAGAEYADFEDWWSACTLGVGPIGIYYNTLTAEGRESVRSECWRLLGRPDGTFVLTASCWFAAGIVPRASRGDRAVP